MNMQDLEKFANHNNLLDYTNHIIQRNGRSIATNGEMMIWINDGNPNRTDISDTTFERMLALIHTHESLAFRAVKIPEFETLTCSTCKGAGMVHEKLRVECPECEDRGFIEFSTQYSTYSPECKTCEGNGWVKKDVGEKAVRCSTVGCIQGRFFVGDTIKFEGGNINPCYLDLIRDYPNLQLATTLNDSGSGLMYYFKNDNGCHIIIMGCRGLQV